METLKKRPNPFEKAKPTEEKVQKPAVQEVQEEPEYVEEPVQIRVQPKPAPRTPQRQTRYVVQEEENRQKYTATMDENLRRRIKIYCATQGIMFSEFIEQACREKLKREGE